KQMVRALEDEVLAKDLLEVRALYRFYRAHREDNELVLVDGALGKEAARFSFPRQASGEMRSLVDLVPTLSGPMDAVCAFVTTCQGKNASVAAIAAGMRDRGELLKSHAFSALAIETAEATAEWLHKKIRAMWGIADADTLTMQDLFSARYRGRRYSFGYPACPRLDDQAILWRALSPQERIGVELTDGMMMDPEASVSALVFQHPQATYFSVGPSDAA
ncbi:MAG TPA: vitamin B12 dependent-methionine synthase activation domain-containing protein, partial [Myxococcota bacterium]